MEIEYPNLHISQEKWNEIRTLKEVLYEPYRLTLIVQGDNCTLSDFYGSWIQAKRKLEQIRHEMAECLVKTMKEREAHLFNHNVMLSAVYLDPRYKFLLNDDERTRAVKHLCELYLRIQKIKPIVVEEIETNEENDDFAIFLTNASKNSTTLNQLNSVNPTDSQMLAKIKEFVQFPPIHYKSNLIEYWENLKNHEPELHEISSVILSVPVAQVSVERAFSSLSYIFNNYRNRLSSNILNEVLLLRLNYDLAPRPEEYLNEQDFQNEDDLFVDLSDE